MDINEWLLWVLVDRFARIIHIRFNNNPRILESLEIIARVLRDLSGGLRKKFPRGGGKSFQVGSKKVSGWGRKVFTSLLERLYEYVGEALRRGRRHFTSAVGKGPPQQLSHYRVILTTARLCRLPEQELRQFFNDRSADFLTSSPFPHCSEPRCTKDSRPFSEEVRKYFKKLQGGFYSNIQPIAKYY
jgi:hypothetical protein